MKFEPKNLDFTLSPYTGMTRKSWIEAGIYMLEGVLCNLPSEDSPCVVPRYETEVTYPNKNTPAWKVQAEYFEGITRTFFIAAPLIKDNPDIEIGGIKLRDYYPAAVGAHPRVVWLPGQRHADHPPRKAVQRPDIPRDRSQGTRPYRPCAPARDDHL